MDQPRAPTTPPSLNACSSASLAATTRAPRAAPGADVPAERLPRRLADFGTMGEALDYAAQGSRGMNFHDARGTLLRSYPYKELRDDALAHADDLAHLSREDA